MQAELILNGHNKYISITNIYPHYINTGMFNGVNTKLKKWYLRILDPGFQDPNFVVNEIYNAILYKKRQITIPNYFGFVTRIGLCFGSHKFIDFIATNSNDVSGFIGRK